MNGGELRQLIDERGMRYRHVAKKAGIRANHLSKILSKKDVSTGELERIARAIDLKPGDLMETTCGELRPLLPIIDVLRSFDDAALPHVMRALEALRAVTNISGRKEIEGGKISDSATTGGTPLGKRSGERKEATTDAESIDPNPHNRQ